MGERQRWFRFYTETTTDYKLKRAAGTVGCERIMVLGIWTAIMNLAKQSPVPGALLIAIGVPATPAEIAEEAGTANVALVEQLQSEFLKLNMLALSAGGVLYLPHWQERQYESDNSTDRVRRHREAKRQHEQEPSETETQRNVSGNESETDQKQSRAETEQKQIQSRAEAEQSEPPAAALPDSFTKPEIALAHEITGLYPSMTDEQKVINNVQATRRRIRYPPIDVLRAELTAAWEAWCATRTKAGALYNPANWDWTEWAATGHHATRNGSVRPGPSPEELLAALEGSPPPSQEGATHD